MKLLKRSTKAFVYSYEESAKTLMDNYLDNVEAYCNKSKLRDPLTGEEMSPDEKLMRSIEEQIESQKMLKSIPGRNINSHLCLCT